MWAERNGKICYGQDRREDELTSSFFGPMRYSSRFGTVFGAILKAAVFEDKLVFEKFLADKKDDEDFEIHFWKRKAARRSDRSFDEIDLLIRFQDSKNIGIEVKFLSGESGEDQLPKYAENWRDEIDFLLIWAAHNEAQSIFNKRTELVNGRAPNLHFGWISWENVLDALLPLIHNLEKPDRVIAIDLKNYLTFKGFDRFISFDKLTTQVEKFAIKKAEYYDLEGANAY